MGNKTRKLLMKNRIYTNDSYYKYSLNPKQIKILRAIQNNIYSQKNIAESLKMESHIVNYYMDLLEKNKFIEGNKEPNMSGELEYLVCWLTNKGKVAVDNPDDLVKESIPYENRNIHINQGKYYENIGGDYTEQSHHGNGDNVAGNKKTIHTNVNPDWEKILLEIQTILEKQEEEFNPNKELGQQKIADATIKEIENKPNLARRIISASEKGFIAYIKARFISPVQSALLAALEEWKPTQK